jgi:chromosome partitioning protein
MKIIAISNQKGGVGKTTTCANLAAGLVQAGKRVLCVDFDPQGNLSDYLGYAPNEGTTITELMLATVQGQPVEPMDAVQHNGEGIDYIPADIRLSGAELFLSQAMFREQVLKRVLSSPSLLTYDYILVDCLPSLGILLTNALIASHRLIIPLQAQKFALSGLDDLLSIINMVREQANPRIEADYISGTTKIAFGNPFTISLSCDGKIGMGGFLSISIPLNSAVSGRSERYWNS